MPNEYKKVQIPTSRYSRSLGWEHRSLRISFLEIALYTARQPCMVGMSTMEVASGRQLTESDWSFGRRELISDSLRNLDVTVEGFIVRGSLIWIVGNAEGAHETAGSRGRIIGGFMCIRLIPRGQD